MEESLKMNEEVTLDLQEILNVLKRKKDDFNNNSIIWNNIRSLKLFIIPPIYEIKASVVIGKTLDEKMK
ncbi:hypothetical protein JTS93_15150 [Clostridium botulinum]|nr:hypothetical protein [Clostridium botulinum]